MSKAVTLTIVNARAWTGDPRRPWAEGVAVADDRIAAVGSSAEVRKLAPVSARLIDARGAMLVPGFLDAHIHFLEGGLRLASVQLRGTRSRDELASRIRAFATTAEPGAWITGGDWDHELWGGELPHHEWIDAASPNNPVWLTRHDGHMGLANSLALSAAGISASTQNVEGGAILRDASGVPTGVLKDNAIPLVARAQPPRSPAQLARALDAAMRYVAEQGVTSVHHVGTWDDLAVFERAHAGGVLRTRISAAVPLASWQRLDDHVRAHGRGDEWLRTGSLKGFMDGSLGSHTAAMFDPYDDLAGERGLLVNDPDDMYEWAAAGDRAGLHAVIHAIGDRANRLLLDIYERMIREHGPRDRRFRIEHAQHLHPSDVPRFGALGVIASMQPYHAIDDGRWAERAIGAERAKTTYAARSLLDAGARIAFGSDWFVAPPTPLEGIYAAVTRRTLDGTHPDGWIPEQRISATEALSAYTSGSAFAMFEERDRGTIERRKLADLVLIDQDLTLIAPPDIASARVLMTIVGGKVVFEQS